MTFSIAGHCPKTGQYGAAVSSSSICVASRCLFVAPKSGVILTQNVTNPVLGQLGIEFLEKDQNAEQVLKGLLQVEKYPQWRQLMILDQSGNSAAHSGNETLGIHATRSGKYCIAGGNMLSEAKVIDRMIQAFEESTDNELAERLIIAMEAGLAAGGEMGPIHSVGLKVSDQASWPVVDLRVDWHIAPLDELRMLWKNYLPQRDDYILRAIDPDVSPSYGVPGDER